MIVLLFGITPKTSDNEITNVQEYIGKEQCGACTIDLVWEKRWRVMQSEYRWFLCAVHIAGRSMRVKVTLLCPSMTLHFDALWFSSPIKTEIIFMN